MIARALLLLAACLLVACDEEPAVEWLVTCPGMAPITIYVSGFNDQNRRDGQGRKVLVPSGCLWVRQS